MHKIFGNMRSIFVLVLLTLTYCVNVSDGASRTWVCQFRYLSVSRIMDTCQEEHFSVFPAYDRTATEESARQWLQQTCANVPNYLSCVTNMTNAEYPGCNNVDDVIREAEKTVAFCDSSSWLRSYALPNIGTVEYACLNIRRTLCVNTVDLLQYPTSETVLQDGLAMARFNMGIVFDCMLTEVQQKVSRVPGCSASWSELFYLILVRTTTNSRLGIRLYPEQIEQLIVLHYRS